MDFFDSHYYKVQKGLLRISGVWPYQTSRIYILLRIIFINGIVNCVMIPETIVFFKNIRDFDYLLECLLLLSGCVMGITKTVILITRIDDVRMLLEEVKHDWKYSKNVNSELSIIEKYAKMGKIISILYVSSIYIVASCFYSICYSPQILDLISPLNESRERFLMFPGDFYFHMEGKFLLLLHIEFYGFLSSSTMIVANDILYMTLMFHSCSKFAVLSLKLENLCLRPLKNKIDLSIEKNNSLTQDQITYFSVVKCIKLHLKTIKYVDHLNSVFSVAFFPDLVFGVLLSSVAAVKFVISTEQPNDQFRFGMIFCAQSMRIFCSTFPGQLVTDHSKYVNMAVYNNKWYELPEKTKKLLILLMLRSGKSSEFVVAKIFSMNLQLFSMVIRTCVSYCTVMVSVQPS